MKNRRRDYKNENIIVIIYSNRIGVSLETLSVICNETIRELMYL